MRPSLALILSVLSMLLPVMAHANGSLFSKDGGLVRASFSDADTQAQGSSLFQKTPDKGLFRQTSRRSIRAGPTLSASSTQLDRLRAIIQSAESRRDGYDAVQHGAKIRPPDRPTRLTLGQIYAWIDDTPGQPHAIGRYQFIPATLRRLVKQLRLPPDTRFSPMVQDWLGDILLAEAGLNKLRRQKITRADFMHNLSKIWAGLPLENGKSYYQGHAGNTASISWKTFDAKMRQIFPDTRRAPALVVAAR